MILDFAIKDFYRKKEQTYPYTCTVMIVVALGIFLINFLTTISINIFLEDLQSFHENRNPYFFNNSIGVLFTNYFTLLIVLVLVLIFTLVVSITTTLISFKQKDIAIFKSLGILPEIIYNFYLAEAFLLFFVSFILGLIISFIAYGIFFIILTVLNFTLIFQVNWLLIFLLLVVCSIGIYFITGTKLRKMGLKKVSDNLSGDLTFQSSTRRLISIPNWVYKIGPNLKIAITNIKRRKKEFIQNFFVFGFICVILITIGVGIINIRQNSREWVNRAQGNNIYVIGHEDLVIKYSSMYTVFSDPSSTIEPEDIEFTESRYLINKSKVENLEKQFDLSFDRRLIAFHHVKEVQGYYFTEKEHINDSGIEYIGDNREGIFPIIGVKRELLIQNFSIKKGFFFNKTNFHNSMVVGDGLSQNFFEDPLKQKLMLQQIDKTYEISGVIRDTFYGGFACYMDLSTYQKAKNLSNSVNFLLLNNKKSFSESLIDDLERNVEEYLGPEFTIINLNPTFNKNIDFISSLIIYPISVGISILLVALLSLVNYQKVNLLENTKDFIIMKAIGATDDSIKKILFMEGIFILIPAIIYGYILGIFLNTIFIFRNPKPLSLLLFTILIPILLVVLVLVNFLSINIPMRKISKFRIEDLKK